MVSPALMLWLAPVAAMGLATLGELSHASRVERARWLAFGPRGAPRSWTWAAAPLRVTALGACTWSLLLLAASDRTPGDGRPDQPTASISERVVILLDVSPSMQLADAGPNGQETRADRARAVLRSVLDRLDLNRTRVSVAAFYSEARPVVIDTFDPEVVANILNDLPLEHAFTPGKTDVYGAVRVAGEIARDFRPQSAVLLLVSDGDTLPASRPPELSEAYAGALVLGVGNPTAGLFIDDHSSRQDAASLKQLAKRLSGTYLDVNARHVPTAEVERLSASIPRFSQTALQWRDVALAIALLSSGVLAFLGPSLALFGGAWHPQHGGWDLHASGLAQSSFPAAGTQHASRASPGTQGAAS